MGTSQNTDFLDALREWTKAFMRRSFQSMIHFAKQENLSMSQMGALMHVSRKGASCVSDIGDDLGVTSAAASQMLERLVQHGLMARTEDPQDRRSKRIELTEEGLSMVRESMAARQRWFEELSLRLAPEDLQAATRSLRVLTEKIQELEKT